MYQLYTIAYGLSSIHDKGFVHRDFHPGNILVDGIECYITDLGLSRPASERDNEEKVYGVLPYVSPEVLYKKAYTQASDIYSFGIVAYEVLSGELPYHGYENNVHLLLLVCEGLRPQFKIKIPQLLESLIKKCWDADPSNRPTSNELYENLHDWYKEIDEEENRERKTSEFYRQYKEIEEVGGFNHVETYQIHSQAVYTSFLLDFKNLPEPQNSKEINEKFYSNSLTVDFTKLGNNYRSKELNFDIEDMSTEELIIRTKRQLSISSQADASLEKTKMTRTDENKKEQLEPMEIIEKDSQYQSQIQIPPK